LSAAATDTSKELLDVGALVVRGDDLVRGRKRSKKFIGVPVRHRRQERQPGDRRLRPHRRVEIRLVAEFVARAIADPHGAAAPEIDRAIEIEMVRPAAHRRRFQLARREMLLHARERRVGIGIPRGQNGQRVAEFVQ
jgi:hypothetical protein